MAPAGFAGVIQLLLLFFLGLGGVPLGYPPLPEDPALLRAIPAGAQAAVQWFGSGPAAKESPNTVVRLVSEQENRRLVAGLKAALLGALTRHEQPETARRIQAALEMAELALSRPGVLFIGGLAFPPRADAIQAGLVLNLGDRKDAFLARFAVLEGALVTELIGEPEEGPRTVRIGETELRVLGGQDGVPALLYGSSGDYFLFCLGQGTAEGVLAGLAGKQAGLGGEARFLALHDQVRVEIPAWRSWIDLPALVELVRPIMSTEAPQGIEPFDRIGLRGLGPILSETGLEGEGCVARTLLGHSGPAQGLFRLLESAPITPAELALIPEDATLASAFRLDLALLFSELRGLFGVVDPGARDELFGELIPGLERNLGIDSLLDLIEPLGDAWCLWSSPSQGGLVLTGLTLSVPLKEPARFLAALEKTMNALKVIFEEQRGERFGRRGVGLGSFAFHGRTIWFLDSAGMGMPVAPAWCVDGERLLAALYPQMIKAELARPTQPQRSLAAHPALAGIGEPLSLTLIDLEQIVRLAWPLITIGAQLALDELKPVGFDLDLSMLPSAAALLAHLGPQVTVLERLELGFRQTVRGPTPMLDPGIGFFLGAGSGLLLGLRSPAAPAPGFPR